MDYKRLVKIENLNGETVAVLRIKGDNSRAEYTFSFIDEELKRANFAVRTGDVYCDLSPTGVATRANFEGDFLVAAVSGGKIVAAGSGLGKKITEEDLQTFEANIKKEQKKDQFEENSLYDDFKIAEENYYEKECLNETDSDVDAQKEYSKARQNERCENETRYDEANACDGEKSGYKPENGCNQTRTNDKNADTEDIGRDEILSKGLDFGERYKFKKLTAAKERFYGFDKVISNSEFYKIGEEKFYYFGAVYEKSLPRYFVYAVPAKRGDPPKGFESGYFIPESFFNIDEGYYCLFQKSAFNFD